VSFPAAWRFAKGGFLFFKAPENRVSRAARNKYEADDSCAALLFIGR